MQPEQIFRLTTISPYPGTAPPDTTLVRVAFTTWRLQTALALLLKAGYIEEVSQ